MTKFKLYQKNFGKECHRKPDHRTYNSMRSALIFDVET